LLVGIFLLALTGATSVSANPFLCCRSGPTVAAAISQVPPIQAGLARVWFLRQLEPCETLTSPMISANGAPVRQSEPGTAFIRDFRPGTYTFMVPSYGVDTGQAATVQLAPGTQTYLDVQSLPLMSSRCAAGRILARTASETLSMSGQFRRIGPRNIFLR